VGGVAPRENAQIYVSAFQYPPPLGAYSITVPFPYEPVCFIITDDTFRRFERDMRLEVFETVAGERDRALVIPSNPVTHAWLNINLQRWWEIAHDHFSRNRRETEICLVTNIRAAKKVAIDYRRNEPDQHYYVFNTQNGVIPENFVIVSNSQSLRLFDPDNDTTYVFWAQYLTKNKSGPFRKSIEYWDRLIEYWYLSS